MAKYPTYPILYDDCKTLSISDLKRWNYINPNQYKSGVIKWSSNGNETSSINIRTSTYTNNSYLELSYRLNEIPINYRVPLVSIPSNLGKGIVWFFICPSSGKRCRKLHFVDTYFYHRSAFRGCMYEKQTKSKKQTQTSKLFDKLFESEKIDNLIYSKHFKKYYNGKPTKRYLQLIAKRRQCENITDLEIKQFLFS